MNNLHQISDIQVAENNQIQKIEAQANAAVIKSIIYEKSTIVQDDVGQVGWVATLVVP